jgi:type I restriction enzyme, S subunit
LNESKKAGWEVGTVSTIAEVNPRTDLSRLISDIDVTFIPMQNVGENGKILVHETRKYSEVQIGYTVFKENDVLFAKITPCMENGKGTLAMGLTEGIGFGSTEFHVLRAKKNGSSEFIFHLTHSSTFRKKAEMYMTGSAGQQRVSKDMFFHYKIPIPPLSEQQKIAEILSTVDESIEKTEAIIVQTEFLKQGLMQEFLVKQTEENKWKNVELGENIDLLTGYPFKSELFSDNPSGIKLVRGDNVTNGKLRWGARTRYWREMTPDLSKYLLRDKDVLIPMDGSLVGRNYVKIIESDLPLLLVQRVARLRTKKDLLPEFLYYLIANSRFSAYVDCVKTVAAIPHISAKDIKEHTIPLPPLIEQQKIASILSSMDEKLEAERKQLEQLKILKKGLMHDLLTGRVRVEVGANA